MIYVNENIIRGSIIKQLETTFGKDYTYYPEKVPQNFKKKSFHVHRITNVVSTQYQGHRYKFENNDYTYAIRYFPIDSTEEIKECNDVLDELKRSFKTLTVYNIDDRNGEKVELTKPTHIKSRTVEQGDGVVQFIIGFDIRTVDIIDKDKVKILELDNKLKEGK